MNNPKILKKVLVAALTLAMIVGAFSMFTVGTSAASADALKLLDGVDFESYTGTTQADAHAYIYEQTGMYFTAQAGTSAATNVDIKDGALHFSSFSYVSGGSGDSTINQDKYDKSKNVLDLLFTANGPAKYTMEFDLIITDEILPTSESAASKPSSPYRGCSMISFGRFNWFVKATSVGVSTYEIVGGEFTPNNDAQADVGYFYAESATIEATETNGVAAANSTVKTGPVTGAMPAGKDKLVAYKIGEPVKIKIEFTKNASNTSAVTYVNGTKLSTNTVTYIDQSKAHGIRWGDSSYAKFAVDNLKLTVNECNADHSTDWSVISYDDAKVSVGYDALDVVARCSCGDYLPVGSVNNVLVATDYVYGGYAAIEGLPTTGEFWIATDYNIRTAEALTTAANIIKIGNEVVAVDAANMTAPATYGVAVKVKYTDTNVADLEVYVDGTLVDTRTGVALENATTLYLGDEGASADIRFFRTKIVELGTDPAVKVTYNNMDDDTLKPCLHVYAGGDIITNVTRDDEGVLSYSFECEKCGEIVYNVPIENGHDEANCGVPGGTFTYANGQYVNYQLPEGYYGSTAEPYQLEFTLTLNAMIDDPSKLDNSGGGRNVMNYDGNFNSVIRHYPVSDSNGGYYTDRVDIKTKTSTPTYLTTMYEGDSITISLYVTPASKTIDIYIDGEYVLTRSGNAPMDTGDKKIRFGDGTVCTFVASDFKLMRKVEEEAHVHSDKWATANERSVFITDSVLEYRYTCYCGEEVLAGQITSSLAPEGIRNAYESETNVLGAPTAPYWLAVDYNVRTADAPTEAVISINGTKLDLTTLVEAVGPTTKIVAISVIDNENYQLYVDGEYVSAYTAENLLAAGGSIEFVTGENVRFNNIKLVTVGETDTPVVPTYIVADFIRPCAHNVGASKNVQLIAVPGVTYEGYTKVKAVNKLMKIQDCSVCGEKLYVAQGDVLTVKDTGSLTLDETGSTTAPTEEKFLHIDRMDVSSAASPYWVSFDIEVNDLKSFTGTVSIFNVQVPYAAQDYASSGDNNAYIHLLRGFALSDRTDAIGVNFFNGSSTTNSFVLEEGVSRHIDIYMDVDEDKIVYYGYVDGVLTYTGNITSGSTLRAYNGNRTDDKVDALKASFRFNSHRSGSYTFSNFAFVEAKEVEHTHSDNWLTDLEKANTTVSVLDNKTLAYEYDCYCGDRVTAGIKTVLADNIAPQYNLTGSAVAVEAPVLDEKAIFAGELAVEALPAEGIKALVSLGELAMISIDADGVVYVGSTATETVLVADAENYIDFAVYFDNGTYTVYLDGANIGNGEYDTAAAITVGSEEIGSVHFDRMVLATVDSYENGTYNVVEDSHAHVFDSTSAELKFNDIRTSITVEYICLECNRPAFDGIKVDLYDDITTEDVIEAIPAIVETSDNGSVIVDGVSEYLTVEREGEEPIVYDSYWFSADFTVEEFVQLNIQPIVSLGDNALVLVDSDGAVRLDDNNKYTVIGAVENNEIFNVTFRLTKVDDTSVVDVYFEGKYFYTYCFDGVAETITAGGEDAPTLSVSNIKLAIVGNGGIGQIGAFSCDGHTFDYENAEVNYLIDSAKFEISRKCLVCGLILTDKPVYNNYKDAITHIYNGYGNITAKPDTTKSVEELDKLYKGSFIVAEVNLRSADIGAFNGYKNLVGKAEQSLVLINSQGQLMLGDGITTGVVLSGTNTYNVAVEIVNAEQKFFVVYVDGEYVGKANLADIKYTYDYAAETENYEEFGAEGLKNIKFYNIKSFYYSTEGKEVTFTYSEDANQVPCPHIVGDAERESMTFLDKLNFYFICSKCGERVHDGYNVDIYATSGDTVFKDGKATISGTTKVKSSVDVLGKKGSNFWLNFKLTPTAIKADNVAAKGAKGGNLLNFDENGSSQFLRLCTVTNPENGEIYSDRLYIRSGNNSSYPMVGLIQLDETYDISLYVMPSTKKVDVYFNGEFITTRTNATLDTGAHIRILDGSYGTFVISEFEMLSCNAFIHEHTDKYSAQMGYTPQVVYGDETLTYKYMCICEEILVEGIETVYADEISEYKNVTTAKPITEAASAKMTNVPYWVSSKVYAGSAATAVYSYGSTEIVGIAGGFYTIGGVATEIAPSGVAVTGDYDVVSIKVIPESDKVEVYINGSYVDSCALEIADAEKFNILIGGAADGSDASLSFKFIKIVSLAKGATGKVTLPVCDHEFGYRFGVTAELTSTGIDYKCKYCEENVKLRTVTIGNGKKVAVSEYDAPKGDHWINELELTEYKDTIFGKSLDGTFFITFDVKATSLAGVDEKAGARKSFVTWTPGTGDDRNADTGAIKSVTSSGYEHLISLKLIDDQYIVYLGNDSTGFDTAGVIELSDSENEIYYNFIFEIDSANGLYYAYMDGQYLGSAKINIELSGKDCYYLRVNNGTGDAYFKNFQMFKPATDKEEEVEDSNATAVHYHFPDVSKEASKSINVKNGKITYSFACSCCKEGQTITLNTMNNIVDEKIDSKFNGLSISQSIQVGDKLSYGTEPFIISFDLSGDVINVATIVNKTKDTVNSKGKVVKGTGASLLAIVRPEDEELGVATDYTHLLRAFGHPYKDGEGYTDKNGDGYADEVIDLRTNTDKNTAAIATIGVGETKNITYVIDPTAKKAVVYLDGSYVATSTTVKKFTADDLYIRILDASYGSWNFNNFKLVRMSDECKHVGPSCDGSSYVGLCTKCNKVSVEVTHNYTAKVDLTGKWTKYTCACGAHYVVFNDMSLVADLTFANKNELLAYLTETYYPVFR